MTLKLYNEIIPQLAHDLDQMAENGIITYKPFGPDTIKKDVKQVLNLIPKNMIHR